MALLWNLLPSYLITVFWATADLLPTGLLVTTRPGHQNGETPRETGGLCRDRTYDPVIKS